MKEESKPKVVFYLTKDQGLPSKNSENKLIMLTLEDHRHNDFGLYSVFDYVYFVNGEEKLSGWLKVALIDSGESSNQFIREKLKDNKKFQFKEAGFFSLQQNIQNYREIVDRLGVDGAKDFLLALNDVVAIKKYKIKAEWLAKSLQSKAFKNSLARNAEAYFAYVSGGSVLDGVQYEEIGSISETIYLKGSLDKNRPALPFEFNFQNILPSRIVTLIGKNGVGKSQSLKALATALISGNMKSVLDKNGDRIKLNRLLAVATAGEIHNTFPRPRKKSKIDYRLISHRRSRHSDDENGLAGLIVKLLRAEQVIGDKKRVDLFREAISSVLPFQKIGLMVSEPDDAELPEGYIFPSPLSEFHRKPEGAHLDFTGRVHQELDPVFIEGERHFPLSSGQISFLRLAAQICWNIENGSLILLDEPETHFHPNFISDLMAFFTRILELSGSIAILATHSAYFVREVPRKQVLVMNRLSDGTVEVVRPRIKTLGAEIGEISFSVFGEQDFGYLIERIKMEIQKTNNSQRFITSDNFTSLVEELPSEAIMYLENELNLTLRSKSRVADYSEESEE